LELQLKSNIKIEDMLRNYLITLFRNIKREKIFTLMNLSGLGLGIGCSLVIFKIVMYEWSYDVHQSKYDRIYRMVSQTQRSTGIND